MSELTMDQFDAYLTELLAEISDLKKKNKALRLDNQRLRHDLNQLRKLNPNLFPTTGFLPPRHWIVNEL